MGIFCEEKTCSNFAILLGQAFERIGVSLLAQYDGECIPVSDSFFFFVDQFRLLRSRDILSVCEYPLSSSFIHKDGGKCTK